jgi:hypothetical protein
LRERGSADADLSTSCLITASRLVILRRRPFSVIVSCSFSASFSRVFEPGWHPPGLPDWPFLNRHRAAACRNPLRNRH